MPPVLHIVASCTERKRGEVPDSLQLRRYRDQPKDTRFGAWRRAINAAGPRRSAARDLYLGDHWYVSRDLATLAQKHGWQARLWIASAGFGLVGDEELLVPYSATFKSGAPDAVGVGSSWAEECVEWWAALTSTGIGGRSPRSVTQLATETPGATILVAASPAYLRAMEQDLETARAALSDRDRMLLISSRPGPQHSGLADAWIPSAASLHSLVGGSLISLHARVARHMLESNKAGALRVSTLRAYYEKRASDGDAAPRPSRTPGDDQEVLAFIRNALASSARATHTGLLREYRDAGRACEQSRFRALFLKAKGAQHA